MHFVRLRRRLRHASGVIFAFSLLLFVFCLLYLSLSTQPIGIAGNNRGGVHYRTPYSIDENNPAEQQQVQNPKDVERQLRQQFLRNASWTLAPPSGFGQGRAIASQLTGAAGESTAAWFAQTMAAAKVVGDPDKALESIQFLNTHHEVLNVDKFGPLTADTVDYVLVVQVHNRIDYLKYLIGSFSRARNIQRTLLVFSHDLSAEPINALVQSINFCRVIQLFFPHNIQLFPNIYPGKDARDCPEGSNKAKAVELKCADAAFPDVGGHYRIPRLLQIKQHWWWKINYLFDAVMPKYGLDEKLLLLLEEDHLVAPDFLHVLRLMEEKRAKVCPDCELLCLGSYPKTFARYGDDLGKLGVELWYSSKYNMGMALGKQLWERIRSENCSKFFCHYDDYNWDWTMMQLSVKCLPNKMRVVYTKAPRVVHIGDCGVHTHRCEADNAVHEALLFERVNASLFPAQLEVADVGKRMLKPSKPNGGWADPRDHRLCLLNTHPLQEEAGQALAQARSALEQRQQENSATTTPKA